MPTEQNKYKTLVEEIYVSVKEVFVIGDCLLRFALQLCAISHQACLSDVWSYGANGMT